MYNIPLFDLNYGKEEIDAVTGAIADNWISSGPRCMHLEEVMQQMLCTKYALTVSNCTAALHLAMLTLGLGPGDEVIVPSLSFVATANAIRYVGAVPVFCDIESLERPVIDYKQILAHITGKTRAIVVMHYGGFACEMDKIIEIARDNNLKVIEDACHGPLSEYKGKKLGTIGDVGCFSFFSNKNISTGEGGALVTNNQEIYEKAKLLRSHGMTSMSYERSQGHAVKYDVVCLGYNYRMDDMRAALGIAQFGKLKADIEKRKVVRKHYIERLKSIKEITIPFSDYTEVTSSYIFPIVINNRMNFRPDRRDKVRDILKEKGIQTSVHYPAIHRFMIYANYNVKGLPITEFFSDNEISLPMYGKLTEDIIDYICVNLSEAIKITGDEQ